MTDKVDVAALAKLTRLEVSDAELAKLERWFDGRRGLE